MKITPVGDIIQLEIAEVSAGALDTSSFETAVEYATVVAVSPDANFKNIAVGDRVFVKAWAIDVINHNGQKYYFYNPATNGLLAKVA